MRIALDALHDPRMTEVIFPALGEKLIAAVHMQLERFRWSNGTQVTLAIYWKLVCGGYFVFDRTFFLFYVETSVLRLLPSRALCSLSRPSAGVAVAELLSQP